MGYASSFSTIYGNIQAIHVIRIVKWSDQMIIPTLISKSHHRPCMPAQRPPLPEGRADQRRIIPAASSWHMSILSTLNGHGFTVRPRRRVPETSKRPPPACARR